MKRFPSRLVFACAAFAAGAMLAYISLATTGVSANKIAPSVLADASSANRASVIILLREQADVSAAYAIKDQDARGWFVYNTLTQHAERTQRPLRAFLDTRHITYQSFWAANMIAAIVDRAQLESLAARDDVARIDSNVATRSIDEADLGHAVPTQSRIDAPASVEWNVTNVNAPQLWAQGFTGVGIVVGVIDTGVRWTHGALARSTGAGTAATPTTISIGTMPFTPAADLVGRIACSHATTLLAATAHQSLEVRSVMTAWRIRSESRPVQNGLPAATWTKASLHRPPRRNVFSS